MPWVPGARPGRRWLHSASTTRRSASAFKGGRAEPPTLVRPGTSQPLRLPSFPRCLPFTVLSCRAGGWDCSHFRDGRGGQRAGGPWQGFAPSARVWALCSPPLHQLSLVVSHRNRVWHSRAKRAPVNEWSRCGCQAWPDPGPQRLPWGLGVCTSPCGHPFQAGFRR